jgi:uncharacterized protein
VKYRQFGKLNWKASALGFGLAHLPLSEGNPVRIDEAQSIEMIRYAIDQGVNYLDLGYPYDIKRQAASLRMLSRALKDGYREKVKIAASLSAPKICSFQDCDRYLNEQLKGLKTERIDFCVLAGLDRATWPKMQELDFLRWAEGALADGRVEYLGFSFHDQYQFLKDIINSYDKWTLCRFQYSFMDIDHHPGVSGINYAAEKGLGVVVSEPLRGGRLIKSLPPPVAAIWSEATIKRSLPAWGLRWVWNHAGISTVTVDMSSMEQVKEDVALADQAGPDSLSVQEEVLVSRVRDAYRKLRDLPCTACRSCMPCPQDIDAPRIFELYNDAVMYGDIPTSHRLYQSEGHSIEKCDECGLCAKTCGRRIDIPFWLKRADRRLGKDELGGQDV